MSNFKLNLPTDIPWERICVTEDMIDPIVCDKRLPAKWQTSLAVFKYTPEDEYQQFPKYNISYLKVTSTITGYQPLDKEIQGKIDWSGVDADTEFTNEVLKDLLNTYHPCNGAILQVIVGPHGNKPDLPLKKYPFFMDFEPKKRELYELATDTNERSSRSIESLNITKSAGSTQSLEVLDIDMGGGGFGMQGSYAGTGGGFNYSAPNGQWGTKRMNSEESLSSRSADVGQEKRESYSYSTQLSQMYHLLDSYHLGTNRVVFFIQPRPHVLEEPSGFVRGPRPVEGIQEFFMVVAQPKEQNDFCVSLRLDTSHLTHTSKMDYDRKSVQSGTALANATLPSKTDHYVERKVRWHVDYGLWTDDINYKHYTKTVIANEVYSAPEGYTIENYNDLVNVNNGNAYSTVSISGNRKSLTIESRATSSIWFQDEGSGACLDNCPPSTLDEKPARAERKVQVNLKSTVRNKKVGEEEALMITTRGLCCCSDNFDRIDIDELVVDIKLIPKELSVSRYLDKLESLKWKEYDTITNISKEDVISKKDEEYTKRRNEYRTVENPDPKYTIRLANELSNYMKTETIKSLNDPTIQPKKFYETDFFTKQLETKLVQYNKGHKLFDESIEKTIPQKTISNFEKYFDKKGSEITRGDLLSMRKEKLTDLTGLKRDEIQQLKLSAMGVRFKSKEQSKNSPHEDKRDAPTSVNE